MLVGRKRFDRDLEEEMRSHVEMQAEENRESGMDDGEARYAARRRFGNPTLLKERSREAWGWQWLEGLWQDVRYALRMLVKSPGFTAVAGLSLALGIGANSALFSVMDVMLLRALPVKDPNEIVEFIRTHPDGARMTNLPYSVFIFFQQDRIALADVFAIRSVRPVLQAGRASEPVRVHQVSGSFFPALRVNALVGRTIGRDDGRAGTPSRVAVLSHGFWGRRFGQDASVVGTTVRLDGEPVTIIGVAPKDFFGVDRSRVPDLWVPLASDSGRAELWVLGRLKPGVSVAQAQARLEPLFGQAIESLQEGARESTDRERKRFLAQKLLVRVAATGTVGTRWTYWDYSGSLKVLVGLTTLVLLIACANLANLLMARSTARECEIGARLALGAGRWRIVRQLLTENLLLALLGGSLGMMLAVWGHHLLVTFLVREPHAVAMEFRLDGRILGFGLVLSLATGVLFGLIPAIHFSGARLSAAMLQGARPGRAARRVLVQSLLVLQVVFSTVLLTSAGLSARSLRNLATADLGLDRANLIQMDVHPAPGATAEQQRQFWSEVTALASAAPGVRNAALGANAAFGYGGWSKSVWFGRPDQAPEKMQVPFNLAGPGYFTTVGIPLLVGREFGGQDRVDSPPVVVNQSFARRVFGEENPVGRRIGCRGRDSIGECEVVGVVADAKYGSVREKVRPMVYEPLAQSRRDESMVLHVRAEGDAAAVARAVKRGIQALEPDALITDSRTLPEVVWGQLRQDRMFATLASFFGVLALLLAGIGIYGTVAYRVARRTNEIGIRVALGAQRVGVLWLVMRETLALLVVGALVGVPAAVAVGRLLGTLLFGLTPSDPVTIAAALASLLAAGGLAAFLPARRAARIDPMEALRYE